MGKRAGKLNLEQPNEMLDYPASPSAHGPEREIPKEKWANSLSPPPLVVVSWVSHFASCVIKFSYATWATELLSECRAETQPQRLLIAENASSSLAG